MKDSTRKTIARLISERTAIRIGSHCVLGYLAADTRGFAAVVGSESPKSGKAPLGIILRETLERHPDAMSVTGGIWQRSTDSEAPTHKMVWVTSDEDGKPDLAKLCREGGGLDKLVRGLGV